MPIPISVRTAKGAESAYADVNTWAEKQGLPLFQPTKGSFHPAYNVEQTRIFGLPRRVGFKVIYQPEEGDSVTSEEFSAVLR